MKFSHLPSRIGKAQKGRSNNEFKQQTSGSDGSSVFGAYSSSCEVSNVKAEAMLKPSTDTINNIFSTEWSQKEARKDLFRYLESIIGLSHKKIDTQRVKDSAKRGWARVMISAIGTYGNLLKDQELEDLEQRLEILEVKQKK